VHRWEWNLVRIKDKPVGEDLYNFNTYIYCFLVIVVYLSNNYIIFFLINLISNKNIKFNIILYVTFLIYYRPNH
jgi:hypothetical protein